MSDQRPLVTIGIVSCNRLHYLRALMESARECIQYEPLQWIIVDNASIEPGLREYVEGLDFVQHKILTDVRRPATEHVDAMNRIIAMSEADYVMILPEDTQFIVRGPWMEDFVELLDAHPNIGTVTFDAQRRVTIRKFFGGVGLRRLLGDRRAVYRARSGREWLGYGRSKPGIAGAGILSFARTSTWERLGPWRATGRQTVADSTGGGEDEMLERHRRSGLRLERCLAKVPVCATIVTDPIGSQARIRGNRRYGRYFAPLGGRYYYRIWDEAEIKALGYGKAAVGFEDVVVPLSFELPYDEQGNVLKNPHQRTDDPFEWLDPSVAGRDVS